MNRDDLNLETGEILDSTELENAENKKKAKEPWSARMDEESLAQLDKIAEEIGDTNKRVILEYLLKVRTTAQLKGLVSGKKDTIENVERALDLIRNEMNTLLRHNINKEDEIRSTISSEIDTFQKRITFLQDKLNDQLTINKELKEENKTLKASLTDKDKELKEINERYASTDKLIAKFEEDELSYKKKLVELEELQATHKNLQTSYSLLEKELATKEATLVKINAELSTVKQSNIDKDKQLQNLEAEMAKEIKSVGDANTKEIEHLNITHQVEVKNILSEAEKHVLEKERELRDKIDNLRDKKDSLETEIASIKETKNLEISMFKEEITTLKSEHATEVKGLSEQISNLKLTLDKKE